MVNPLLNLTELDGVNGFAIAGTSDFGNLGEATSNAGDFNGDGFNDLIIGAPEAGTSGSNSEPYSYGGYQGEAYIIFGKSDGFDAKLNPNKLNGKNGFVVKGLEDFDNLSEAASSAGDVNGDGFDDLIIGAPLAGVTTSTSEGYKYDDNRGRAYVVFGRSKVAASFDLNKLNGNNGFVIEGLDGGDNLGAAASNIGDINGDGFDDLAVGAPKVKTGDGYSSEGEAYVIFGDSTGFTANFNLDSLDGSNGFVVPGLNSYGNLGAAISNAGDVNGDGFDDLIIGASYAGEAITSPYGYKYSNSRGEAYIIFGGSNSFAAEFDLSSLDGSNGFMIRGLDNYDDLGSAVSDAGDINGDGFDDLIVGAPNANVSSPYSSEGEAYVIFGDNNLAAEFDLSSLDGSNGFMIRGLDNYDDLGSAVSGAGDINGDGFDDIIVGAPDVNVDGVNDRGEAYIVFGSDKGFSATVDLASLNSDRGFAIQGIDGLGNLGTAVSNAGDLNGDGLDDLIVGAPSASINNRGTAYVIFGFQPSKSIGTAADDTLIGNSGDNFISGLGGSDRLEGLGGNDEILGGLGDDLILAGEGNDAVFGGGGKDKLEGDLGEDTLDGGVGGDTLAGGKGNDILTGRGGQDLLRGNNGSDILYGGVDADILTGGAGGDRLNGNGGRDNLYSGSGNDTLNGGTGSDILAGGKGNDILNGGDDKDRLIGVALNHNNFGAGEKDTLNGGAGSDIFVLGNQNRVFYDDGNNFSSGDADYALISDFDPQQDIIQLSGTADRYLIDFLPGSRGIDAKVVYTPGIESGSELIGLIENVADNLSLTNSAFVFV